MVCALELCGGAGRLLQALRANAAPTTWPAGRCGAQHSHQDHRPPRVSLRDALGRVREAVLELLPGLRVSHRHLQFGLGLGG